MPKTDERAMYRVYLEGRVVLSVPDFGFASGYAYALRESGKAPTLMGYKFGDSWGCVITLPT